MVASVTKPNTATLSAFGQANPKPYQEGRIDLGNWYARKTVDLSYPKRSLLIFLVLAVGLDEEKREEEEEEEEEEELWGLEKRWDAG